MIALGVGAAAVATLAVTLAADGDGASYATLPTMLQSTDTPYVAPGWVPAALTRPGPDGGADEAAFERAAQAAWAFMDRHHSASTGLVSAQPTWAFPTVWDIGSTLAAYFSAHRLGYLATDDYERRVGALLRTMASARMYDGIAYGRNYDYRTGELVGHDQAPSADGTGYSAIDLGRLLIWLKIIALDLPDLADDAERVAHRLDASRIVRDGYMHGVSVTPEGEVLAFQEGRIGYEQYAATGFGLWDMTPDSALSLEANATRAEVLGLPLMRDRRGLDRLTSEPLVLAGMEVGWSDGMAELAWQTLAAQARRYEQTGQVTIVSEDAVAVAPHYFYYYCVYCSGEPFTINVHRPGTQLDEPRWISTKAAFAWHALLPSAYTWLGVEAVQSALDPAAGWSSGVYEGTGESTETHALNTSAVILEAALYRRTGQPFIRLAGTPVD